MRAVEFLAEEIQLVKLGPQLFVPHPKAARHPDFTLTENMMLKPRAAKWTSTAKQTDRGFTSAWVEWCLYEMPSWVGNEGVLYDVAPGTKILSINSDRIAIEVARHYGAEIKNVMDLVTQMPWSAIANDYDAVNYNPINVSADLYMRSWDVESTAWFNNNGLTNPRTVAINKPARPTANTEPQKKQPRFMTRRRR